MPYEGVAQRVGAFDAKHGASELDDGWILFEDGAMREANPLGPLMEPPANDWHRAKRILHYHDVRLRKAVRRFEDRKGEFVRMAQANLKARQAGPAPNVQEAEVILTALQDTVKKCQAAREKAHAEVERTSPARLRQKAEEDARNRQANEDALTALGKIEV